MSISVQTFTDGSTNQNLSSFFELSSFVLNNGDMQVILFERNTSVSVSGVTDTAGSTWANYAKITPGSSGAVYEVWAAFDCPASASNTVTLTLTSAQEYVSGVLFVVTGLVGGDSAFDNTGSAYTTGATSIAPTISTSKSSSIIFAITSQHDVLNVTTTFSGAFNANASGMFPGTRGGQQASGNFNNAAFATFTSTQSSLVVTSTFGSSAVADGILAAFDITPSGSSGGGCSQTWGNFSF